MSQIVLNWLLVLQRHLAFEAVIFGPGDLKNAGFAPQNHEVAL